MSLFARLFGRTKTERVEPLSVADWRNDLRRHIERQVAAGYTDEAAILTEAVDVFDGECEPLILRGEAQRVLRAALAAHWEAQQDWPVRTDCDRLDDAFAALERGGVVARQNFTCCGTCGSAEIGDEMEVVSAAGVTVRGYVFFHMQDTDSAVEGDGLYLNYGATEDGEDAALAVAREIVAELEAHGLRTNWTGSWDQRIAVTLDWKRRR
jgi:hypothetical protein